MIFEAMPPTHYYKAHVHHVLTLFPNILYVLTLKSHLKKMINVFALHSNISNQVTFVLKKKRARHFSGKTLKKSCKAKNKKTTDIAVEIFIQCCDNICLSNISCGFSISTRL